MIWEHFEPTPTRFEHWKMYADAPQEWKALAIVVHRPKEGYCVTLYVDNYQRRDFPKLAEAKAAAELDVVINKLEGKL